MNRRELLKAAATAGLALAALSLPPRCAPCEVEAVALGLLLRGTADGRVLESLDGGASWQVVSKLGDHCAIRKIGMRNGEAFLLLETQGHTFALRSR